MELDTLYPLKLVEEWVALKDVQLKLDAHSLQFVHYKTDSISGLDPNDCFLQMSFSSKRELRKCLDTLDRSKHHYHNGCLLTELQVKGKKVVELVDTRGTATGFVMAWRRKKVKISRLFFDRELGINRIKHNHLGYESSKKTTPTSGHLHIIDWIYSYEYGDRMRTSSQTLKKKLLYDTQRKQVFALPYYKLSDSHSLCNGGRSNLSLDIKVSFPEENTMLLENDDGRQVRFNYKDGFWVRVFE